MFNMVVLMIHCFAILLSLYFLSVKAYQLGGWIFLLVQDLFVGVFLWFVGVKVTRIVFYSV